MTDMVIEGFTDREFSAAELTETINIIPNNYGLVTQMGIFGPPKPLSTTYFRLERANYTLNLLPSTERGAPGSKGRTSRRDVKIFEVPSITHEDEVTVADVQNLRAFGSMAPRMLEDKIGEKLLTMANKHQLTHEWYRVQALQGKILDADGSTMINYFTEFGITQSVAAFGAGGVVVSALLRNIKRHMEANLKGEVMSGIGCLASPEFMELLFADAEIKAAYNAAMAAHSMYVMLNPTLRDRRFSFSVQEITFVEYIGSADAPNADGTFTNRKFIPAGDARFFPLGTMNTANQYVAPGDFEEAVNMPGQLFYAKESRDKWGRSRELLTQSNLLVLWNRPELLVRGTNSGSGGTL